MIAQQIDWFRFFAALIFTGIMAYGSWQATFNTLIPHWKRTKKLPSPIVSRVAMRIGFFLIGLANVILIFGVATQGNKIMDNVIPRLGISLVFLILGPICIWAWKENPFGARGL